MNCVGHIQHGMWTHPRDHSTEYNTIEYWQGLAHLAERGKLDGIFLADIVGVYDVYRGGPAPLIGRRRADPGQRPDDGRACHGGDLGSEDGRRVCVRPRFDRDRRGLPTTSVAL